MDNMKIIWLQRKLDFYASEKQKMCRSTHKHIEAVNSFTLPKSSSQI